MPFSFLRRAKGLSERGLVGSSGLSRGCIRQLSHPEEVNNPTLRSIAELAEFFEADVEVLLSPKRILSEFSTVGVAFRVERDGFDSWRTHFFNFVDEFRRTLDPRPLILPPHEQFDQKLKALLASIVVDLTKEFGISTPLWASRRYFLEAPWFVSGMNSLKATALRESPLPYRANNIFVHDNFLSRA